MLISWRYDRGDFECRGGWLVNQQSEGIVLGNMIEWSELVICGRSIRREKVSEASTEVRIKT